MISNKEIRDFLKEQFEPKFDDREIDDFYLDFGKFDFCKFFTVIHRNKTPALLVPE